MPIFFILFLSSFILNAKPTIVIDPGHGGRKVGAVHKHVYESHIALAISKKLKKELDLTERYTVQLTRDKDTETSLKERTLLANKLKADLFISIHANHSSNHRTKGAEFYFQNQLPPQQEEMFLANKENISATSKPQNQSKNTLDIILDDLRNSYRIKKSSQLAINLFQSWNRDHRRKPFLSIRQAPFYVVKYTKMPSVLVEVGYLSNAKDRKRLLNTNAQKKMAQDISRAINYYFNSL